MVAKWLKMLLHLSDVIVAPCDKTSKKLYTNKKAGLTFFTIRTCLNNLAD